MKELGIDIETYSGEDLAKCGVYRYAESPDFAVLLFAYSADNGPVQCVDLASGETLPDEVRAAITDPSVVKTAWNAAFERTCLRRLLGSETPLDPAQWRCTMVRSARMGLPLALGECARVLGPEQGKMEEGRSLIRFFSRPSSKGVRHMPSDAPERWETFKRYCIRDVEVEQALLGKLRRLQSPAFDDELYIADQEINDRGVLIDRALVDNAARFDEEYKAELAAEAREITGMDNPNSAAQIKQWLLKVTGISFPTLNKASIGEIADRLASYPAPRRLIEIRREMAKTSNGKYRAMQSCVCSDGRIRGLLQFCGAARTGRWAGRLVQVQNLPQNHLRDLDRARCMVKAGDLAEFEMSYEVTKTLSELIRTAFVARGGCVFHVCDFSAIEARVIAWLAGEDWVLDVFRADGDIYCATASQMFGVPVEKHGRNAELRQKGKISVLALGYGGGVSALEAMGGSRLGLSEQEERETVRLWREANRRIVRLWSVMERAAVAAIAGRRDVEIHRGVVVGYRWGMLTVTLPSGRTLCYPDARIGAESGDGWRGTHDVIEYAGVDQTTQKWRDDIRTYGGKLTENAVQGIARDILGEVILRARRRGLEVVFHIHDEIVVEAPEGTPLGEVEALFSEPIEWCRDLPLKGAGYTTPYYLKD